MKYIFIALVKFYKKFISPLTPPSCRFKPTCSTYCIEALQKRGLFVGLALTAWRILRCNPFCKGGYDPVPEPRKEHKRIEYPAKKNRVSEKEHKDGIDK